MTNAIHYSTDRIFNEVPYELLAKAFPPLRFAGYADNRSLEERVRDEIIVRKVLVDANLIGGQQVTVPLDSASARILPEGVIWEVPMHLTQGRKIMSALSVEYNTGHTQSIVTGGAINNSHNALGNAATDVYLAANGPSSIGSPRVDIVGPNTVFLRDSGFRGSLLLRCVLENDPYLANISPRHYLAFGDMCIYAARSLIFNRLQIQMAEGSIQPGSINGYIRQALDNMADSEEMYREMRDGKWRKLSMMNDGVSRNQINRLGLFSR